MISQLTFTFDELQPDYQALELELGFGPGELPEPFGQYLADARQFAATLTDMAAVYRLCEPLVFSPDKRRIEVGGHEFKPGKTIAHELRGAQSACLFICTAGSRISDEADRMMRSDDPVYGYLLNLLGSAIAEAVADRVQQLVAGQAEQAGLKITNRYSPGYCHWDVAEQHRLFALFGSATAGVRLTASALMSPVKSVSGIIGIGREVEFRHYHCDLCNLPACVYRGK